MGAFNEMLLTTMDRLEEIGREHRGTRTPQPSDPQLWELVHQIAPELFCTWDEVQEAIDEDPALSTGQIADQLDQLRDAYDKGRDREPGEQDVKRLEGTVEQGLDALWGAFASAYPEVETGDFGPAETVAIEQAVRQAFELMLFYNRPLEGLAPTATDAAAIVASRRAAAIERLTPMAEVVDGLTPINELAVDAVADSIRDVVARRNFSPIGDDVAEEVLTSRAHGLIDNADGVADMVGILIDLIGDHRAANKLVEYAEGALCNEVVDGEICGASTADGGWDGKCGHHADRAAARDGNA